VIDMRVGIYGYLRIKELGKVIKNDINYQQLMSVLFQLLNNTIGSNTGANQIVIQGYSGNASVSIGTSTITFSASITVPNLNGFNAILYGYFNLGLNKYMIQLATINTTEQIPAGTYTFEWVINFTDSSGIIFNLMALSLTGNLKSVSVSFSPSPSQVTSALTGNNITWYLGYQYNSNTTITSIQISVTLTNQSGATSTYTNTQSVNYQGQALAIPFNIQVY